MATPHVMREAEMRTSGPAVREDMLWSTPNLKGAPPGAETASGSGETH
jgi:hypothetical protein